MKGTLDLNWLIDRIRRKNMMDSAQECQAVQERQAAVAVAVQPATQVIQPAAAVAVQPVIQLLLNHILLQEAASIPPQAAAATPAAQAARASMMLPPSPSSPLPYTTIEEAHDAFITLLAGFSPGSGNSLADPCGLISSVEFSKILATLAADKNLTTDAYVQALASGDPHAMPPWTTYNDDDDKYRKIVMGTFINQQCCKESPLNVAGAMLTLSRMYFAVSQRKVPDKKKQERDRMDVFWYTNFPDDKRIAFLKVWQTYLVNNHGNFVRTTKGNFCGKTTLNDLFTTLWAIQLKHGSTTFDAPWNSMTA